MKWYHINRLGSIPAVSLIVALPRLVTAVPASLIVATSLLLTEDRTSKRAQKLVELESFWLKNVGLGCAELIPILGLVVHDCLSDNHEDHPDSEFFTMNWSISVDNSTELSKHW